MIVTIDGPAGAGKSSVARTLAERLGFFFLDTGAMYRAVALAGDERRIDWNDPAAPAALAREITIELAGDRVLVDSRDVTAAIRTPDITRLTQRAADNPEVRQHLVALQRQIAEGKNVVSEGRDQGTVVFPDAACKIYLTASPRERALRRMRDLVAQGEQVELEEVLAEQEERDRRDRSRPYGGLVAAPDAAEINTDGLPAEEVVARLEQLVRSRM